MIERPIHHHGLMLGADADTIWNKKLAAVQAEFNRWRETAMITAFNNG